MGRLIDTSNIRVKPQYMQDVMGIAMIRCEDLLRILADTPTAEAIPKVDIINMLEKIKDLVNDECWDFDREHDIELPKEVVNLDVIENIIQQKIDALKGDRKCD